jgi:hypothetical protein
VGVAVGDATGETKGRRSRSGDYREMGPGLKKDRSHVPFDPSRLRLIHQGRVI